MVPSNIVKVFPTYCRLCGTPGPVCDSHIFPDFFIRSLEEKIATGKHGEKHPTSIVLSMRDEIAGGRKQRGYWEKRLGIKEPLLCSSCERQFSLYEDYFRRFFYGNASGRLLKQTVGQAISGGIAADLIEVREVVADYKMLKLFVMSLIWRSHVAAGEFFEGFTVGSTHEARLRAALRAEDPGDENVYAFWMSDFRTDNGDGLVDFFENPTNEREPDGIRLCRITLGGFQIMVHLGSLNHPPPSDILRTSIRKNGKFLLLVVRGERMIGQWAGRLGKANKIPPKL